MRGARLPLPKQTHRGPSHDARYPPAAPPHLPRDTDLNGLDSDPVSGRFQSYGMAYAPLRNRPCLRYGSFGSTASAIEIRRRL